jgi:hypothetical protein
MMPAIGLTACRMILASPGTGRLGFPRVCDRRYCIYALTQHIPDEFARVRAR